ncbi:hypothetical protein DC415_21615 [Agrobacterium tumefaciens]|uniref:Uncharacterized protein n=1 Tax=Rhizobium rhizogenes TaxID=359 RepID=A0AA92BZB0_RHIRH|nr:hypothetical protein DC430_22600 [Rhizobium rhizogenes]PVE62565.1 hypothetical protein DC415_21615 [Agrobacterium tumefaciens]PVE70703.1 hypothetical protein DCP16_21615 [Sphingomonas sp. TPD3009]
MVDSAVIDRHTFPIGDAGHIRGAVEIGIGIHGSAQLAASGLRFASHCMIDPPSELGSILA